MCEVTTNADIAIGLGTTTIRVLQSDGLSTFQMILSISMLFSSVATDLGVGIGTCLRVVSE